MQKKGNTLSPKMPELLYAGVAGLISALAYASALQGAFVWDDELYVTGNSLLGDLSFQGIKNIFTAFVAGNYHPLTLLSLAFEYPFAGESTRLYHLTNLIIHGCNTALLWLLLAQKLKLNRNAVFLITLAFGVHPLHAESVAWISERKDVLYAFFYLLALHTGLKGNSLSLRMGMILLFIASGLSKAVAVTFPIVWMMAEFYRSPEAWKKILKREALWLGIVFILSLGLGILAIKAQDTSLRDYTIYSLSDNFFIGSYALLFYPVKMLLPISLSAFYPYPEKTGMLPPLPFLIAPLLVLLCLGIIWRFRKQAPELWQGALLYLVLILPVAQFLPVGNAIAADRYSYLASWGIGWMACALLRIPLLQKQKSIPKILGIGLVVILFFMSWERSKVWDGPAILWQDVIKKEPGVPLSYYNLGNYYLSKQQPEKAIPYFEKASSIDPKQNLHPNFTHAWNNLGNAYLKMKNYEMAESIYRKVLTIDPSYTGALINLGNVYSESGRFAEAIQEMEKALLQIPGHTGLRNNLALAYYQNGNPEQALNIYTELSRENPADIMLLHQRGISLVAMGRTDEALELYAECLKRDTHFQLARMNAAVALSQTGKTDTAIALLRIAARAGYPNAQEALRNNGLDW